jgi:hypothetical protein
MMPRVEKQRMGLRTGMSGLIAEEQSAKPRVTECRCGPEAYCGQAFWSWAMPVGWRDICPADPAMPPSDEGERAAATALWALEEGR